jgi:hypothetical protein
VFKHNANKSPIDPTVETSNPRKHLWLGSGAAALAVTCLFTGCGSKTGNSTPSNSPSLSLGVCEGYAAPVLPKNIDLCNNSAGDRNSLGWVLQNDSTSRIVTHLVETRTVPDSDSCVQTTDFRPAFRICDMIANPYYYKKEPLVASSQFIPDNGPTISISTPQGATV